MMRMNTLKIGAALVLALAAYARPARAQAPSAAELEQRRDQNLRAYTDLLRSDLRAQKVAVITDVMGFTEAEDKKFWPIYREYEAELVKINDERLKLIADYSAKYDGLTDADADRLAVGALGLEAKRHALKVSYYDKFKAALSPKTAARFLQVENQILLILDLQIAASLPLASR
jgi:hypothetical protein